MSEPGRGTCRPFTFIVRPELGWLWAAILITGLGFSGCAFIPGPTQVPMAQMSLTDNPEAPCVVVLLPGRFGSPSNFSRANFHQEVVNRGLNIELIAVDAHLGYYKERSIPTRLNQDVVQPLLAKNKEVWMSGVSLGGLGSLLYLRHFPEDLAGVVPMAPFLGDKKLVAEIQAAGGAQSWAPSSPPGEKERSFPALWEWLILNQSLVADKVRLGYGLDDRLAPAGSLLAEMLPEPQVVTREGGHDWPVWSKIWADMLDREQICSTAPKVP